MKDEVSQQLIALNRQFYQTFGNAFASTRRRIQPGITKILDDLPLQGDWLDLGCGSGTVASAWAQTPDRKGLYIGLDFSDVLIHNAEEAVSGIHREHINIHFIQADITTESWGKLLNRQKFDVITAFAVLHHIPGKKLQNQLLEQVGQSLSPGGLFVHSVWQFQHSPKLMNRRQSWSLIGLSEDQLDPGDTLLDWRHALPGQEEQVGLRYVHLYDREELKYLAEDNGFEILDTFESDGRGGKLGLYQVWKKIAS